MAERTTRGIQMILGLWIALTAGALLWAAAWMLLSGCSQPPLPQIAAARRAMARAAEADGILRAPVICAAAQAALASAEAETRLASARAIPAPWRSHPGPGSASDTGGGLAWQTLYATCSVVPENARTPVKSWYITTPAAKRSARQSTPPPLYCSGAM